MATYSKKEVCIEEIFKKCYFSGVRHWLPEKCKGSNQHRRCHRFSHTYKHKKKTNIYIQPEERYFHDTTEMFVHRQRFQHHTTMPRVLLCIYIYIYIFVGRSMYKCVRLMMVGTELVFLRHNLLWFILIPSCSYSLPNAVYALFLPLLWK